jgi:hypothetical protein
MVGFGHAHESTSGLPRPVAEGVNFISVRRTGGYFCGIGLPACTEDDVDTRFADGEAGAAAGVV